MRQEEPVLTVAGVEADLTRNIALVELSLTSQPLQLVVQEDREALSAAARDDELEGVDLVKRSECTKCFPVSSLQKLHA